MGQSRFKFHNPLLVGQVVGDASIVYGAAAFDLGERISAAKAENPQANIYVKLHPETIQGFRKGYFSECGEDSQIYFITEHYNPPSVLEAMDKVYVATSQMRFLKHLIILSGGFGWKNLMGYSVVNRQGSCLLWRTALCRFGVNGAMNLDLLSVPES